MILLVMDFSSLFLGAGAAYIQATLGFVDCSADTLQRRATSRAADIECVSETAVFGVEPEVVRYHLFDPHSTLTLDCVAIERGDHCHFFRALYVTVDEWVISDLSHGLHHPFAEKVFVSHFSAPFVDFECWSLMLHNHRHRLLTVCTWSSECCFDEMALYTTHWTREVRLAEKVTNFYELTVPLLTWEKCQPLQKHRH